MRRLLWFLGCLAAVAAGYAFVFGLIDAFHLWPWPSFAVTMGLLFLASGRWRP